jgi:4-hydroxy-3-polyprenylbenzoate decarboxylase
MDKNLEKKKRVVICISGASGVGLGLKLYSLIPEEYEKYLILSKHAQVVLEKEEGVFWEDDISAPPASGSFGADITFITPTSMNTLAKIATGIEDNLITRVAAVAIKERKPLLLAPREIPFPLLHLEHMAKLARFSNVIIAPPVVTYYTFPNTLQEMEYAIIGRWMDLVGIENELYRRWRDDEEEKRKRALDEKYRNEEEEKGEREEKRERLWVKKRENEPSISSTSPGESEKREKVESFQREREEREEAQKEGRENVEVEGAKNGGEKEGQKDSEGVERDSNP